MKILKRWLKNAVRKLNCPSIVSLSNPRFSRIVSSTIEVFPGQQIRSRANTESIIYEFGKKNILFLDNVIVFPNCSLATTLKGEIIEETAFNSYRLNKLMLAGNELRFDSEITIDGVCTSIDCGSMWSNYYHALIDVWSRLYSLKHTTVDDIVLLVARRLSPYEQSLVTALLPPNVTLKFIPEYSRVRASRYMWLPYLSGDCAGFLPSECLEWYRTQVFTYFGLNSSCTTPDRRIYISRERAERRRYTNETRLVKELRKYDFETFYLEELDFKDQVELFQQASIVFARHGAGLTNLLFVNPDCKVIEHFSDIPLHHYRLLSASLGLKYHQIVTPSNGKNADVDAPINQIVDIIRST